jgi:SAM-dependent methyltransferase
MSESAGSRDEEWFERWFGDEYLALYPHRDMEEARRAAGLVIRESRVAAGATTLDLACGAGRHLEALREQGFRAFGLDLSYPLLLRARERAPVVRGDMRVLPFRSASLDLVASFFTSFGYFEDAADDRQVLREVRRVLRPGAAFAFDYLNSDRVRTELQPRDEREVDGRRVVQIRTLADGGRAVKKQIQIYPPGVAEPQLFHERVRLYPPDEFRALLLEHGLGEHRIFGDYEGAPFEKNSSRLLVIGVAL